VPGATRGHFSTARHAANRESLALQLNNSLSRDNEAASRGLVKKLKPRDPANVAR
jgi:hypothetical protein